MMRVTPLFQNRTEAGKLLALRLKPLIHDSNAIVLALPRGGVPVGFEVAHMLEADLDIFLVRKLGVPGHEELAMGGNRQRRGASLELCAHRTVRTSRRCY